MSNIFKSLDMLFPTVESGNRYFGEVVGVNFQFHLDGVLLGHISWKEKSAWRNASVNAFHTHRQLSRLLKDVHIPTLPRKGNRLVKRMIALCILSAYLDNFEVGKQYTSYGVNIFVDRKDDLVWTEVFGFQLSGTEDVDREIVDPMLMSLAAIVDLECIKRIGRKPSDDEC